VCHRHHKQPWLSFSGVVYVGKILLQFRCRDWAYICPIGVYDSTPFDAKSPLPINEFVHAHFPEYCGSLYFNVIQIKTKHIGNKTEYIHYICLSIVFLEVIICLVVFLEVIIM
jgi:hypothetical protein